MELYLGHIDEFIEPTTHNQIASTLSDAFFDFVGNPSLVYFILKMNHDPGQRIAL